MMVAGADTLLDKLSNNGSEITLKISDEAFTEHEDSLYKTSVGLDKEYLKAVGHAEVDEGAYYHSSKLNHDLWLCPVTRYVFGGNYPKIIYYSTVKN